MIGRASSGKIAAGVLADGTAGSIEADFSGEAAVVVAEAVFPAAGWMAAFAMAADVSVGFEAGVDGAAVSG
jgi:hypothetical protein